MSGQERTPAEDPDREVLARVASGEVEVFGELVARHERRLLRLCERMLGSPEAARDAAQEVFLKAFRNAAKFRPRGKVYTWLYRIAVNHCLNRLRRRKIVQFFSFAEMSRPAEDGEDLEFEAPAETPDAERTLASKRHWDEARRLIGALPPGQRAVLVLAKFEGLSYKAIAETLEITEGAVESRLFRAMRRLDRLRAQEKEK